MPFYIIPHCLKPTKLKFHLIMVKHPFHEHYMTAIWKITSAICITRLSARKSMQFSVLLRGLKSFKPYPVPFVAVTDNAWTLATGILIFCCTAVLEPSCSTDELELASCIGCSGRLSFRLTFPATLSDRGLTCRRRAVTWNTVQRHDYLSPKPRSKLQWYNILFSKLYYCFTTIPLQFCDVR